MLSRPLSDIFAYSRPVSDVFACSRPAPSQSGSSTELSTRGATRDIENTPKLHPGPTIHCRLALAQLYKKSAFFFRLSDYTFWLSGVELHSHGMLTTFFLQIQLEKSSKDSVVPLDHNINLINQRTNQLPTLCLVISAKIHLSKHQEAYF